VGRQCVHGHSLSARLPFCQRFQRAGRQNPRFSQSCARSICKPFFEFFLKNCCSLYLQSSAWLCVCCRRDSPSTVDSSLFLISIAVCRGEKRFEPGPFSNVAQDTNEEPEDYRISWALRSRLVTYFEPVCLTLHLDHR